MVRGSEPLLEITWLVHPSDWPRGRVCVGLAHRGCHLRKASPTTPGSRTPPTVQF